jgi:uncharacterized protein (TIGR02996 family)
MTTSADALDPSNPDLEAAIIRNPKDDAAWQVYADWLNERGAVRGELAALQLAREKRKLPSLRKRAEALLEEHEELFYGPGYEDFNTKIKWKAGFWKSLVIESELDIALDELLALRSARLLQSLKTNGTISASDAAKAILKVGSLPALRHLALNEHHEYGNADIGSVGKYWGDGLDKLPAALPNLRSLDLTADELDFGSFPKLLRLELYAGIASSGALRALFSVDLPRLRTMKLTLGDVPDEERYIYHSSQDLTPFSLSAFEGLLDAKRVPRLTKLEVKIVETGRDKNALLAELKKMLAGSPVGKQVAELVLS